MKIIEKLKKVLSQLTEAEEKELIREISEYETSILANAEKDFKKKFTVFNSADELEKVILERLNREKISLNKEIDNLKNLNLIMKNDGKDEEAEQIIAVASTLKDEKGNPLQSEIAIKKVLEKYDNFRKVVNVSQATPEPKNTQNTKKEPVKNLPNASEIDPDPTRSKSSLEDAIAEMTKKGSLY